MCIYYKYTLYLDFSGPNSDSFLLPLPSPLPYDEFVWRAFSSWAKAWMHIPHCCCFFLSVKWVIWSPGESRAVRTSLVMTHSMFASSHYSFMSWVCWARLQSVGLFGGVRWMSFFALLRWNLADSLAFLLISVWAKKQNPNGRIDFCKYFFKKTNVLYVCVLCGHEVFP